MTETATVDCDFQLDARLLADSVFVADGPLSQVRLVRQSLKRSGLGARVFATVTVRNRHEYAIKDVEILCAFRGRDGYVTARRQATSSRSGFTWRTSWPMSSLRV